MTDLLFLTNSSDFALDRVVHWLQQSHPSIRIDRVNREDRSMLTRLSTILGESGWTATNPPKVAWLRQFLPERDPFGPVPAAEEVDDILVERRQWLSWTHVLGCLGTTWLNEPGLASRAESKILQLEMARRLGFATPRTLLTCSHESAATFISNHGPCVIKSLTAAYWEFSDQAFVFTSDASIALTVEAREWAAQPLLVQEKVDGSHDARLYVIGNEVVAACRERTTTDWRTDPGVEWFPWIPDPDTKDRAVSIVRAFGLDYGALDFILTPGLSSNATFLECNPAGEFGFLDEVLDQQPSRLLGALLARMVNDC